jgi:hypothetical protein
MVLHQLMMRLEWRVGDVARARMHAEALLAAGSSQTTAKLVILHQLRQQGELAQAVARLDALLDPPPRRRAAQLRLLRQAADIANEAGDAAGARRWAARLLELQPNNRKMRKLLHRASMDAETRSLKLVHRASIKTLPLDELRAEVSAWLARGGAAARVAAPTALRIAFHEDRDWRSVIAHADRVNADNLEATTHRILALARLGEIDAAHTALAAARERVRPDGVAALFRDELDVTEANVAALTGNLPQQLASINRLLGHYGLAPIDARQPLAPALVTCDAPRADVPGPRVAVVMTVYGHDQEAELRAAVGSILAQSYQQLELILVDDCSPDDTLALLHVLAEADPRVRVYQTPVNGGTYRAKNLGISKTDAPLIAFMDSDDWSHPQRIERQVQSLTDHPDAVAVVHNSLRIDQDGWIEFRQRASRFAYISTMLRRAVIEQLGYFDSVRVSGDAEIIARLRSFYGADAVLHEPLPSVLMARHDGSLTGGGTHYIGWRSVTGDRLRYHRAFKQWHERCRADGRPPYVDLAPDERPFPAPESVLRKTKASPALEDA